MCVCRKPERRAGGQRRVAQVPVRRQGAGGGWFVAVQEFHRISRRDVATQTQTEFHVL